MPLAMPGSKIYMYSVCLLIDTQHIRQKSPQATAGKRKHAIAGGSVMIGFVSTFPENVRLKHLTRTAQSKGAKLVTCMHDM